tara:strand:+ start:619 stop:828 length:210 start_codon:yes stop_codon:yes gene_type:complete
MKKELPRVEWMFSFEGGGWNSVYAKTKKGAISVAMKEYKKSDILNPISSSFKRVDKNPKLYKSLMSLFY